MEKGNIVKSKTHDSEGMILALTKDGKRAKVKVFGRDDEVWRPLSGMTVLVDGWETCWKCGGSGIFQGGGGVHNGVFTGYTGECYACAGKGKQDNADRLRNHYYWHRQAVLDVAVAEAERGEFESLERTAEKMAEPKPARPVIRAKKKKQPSEPKGKRSPVPGSSLIDCGGCHTLHREDSACPW